MFRRLAAAAAVTALLLTASPSQALQPQDPRLIGSEAGFFEDGLFRVAYSTEIWQVSSTSNQAKALTPVEYENLEDKSFKPARTDYVKYPWSDTLYGVTFFGSDQSTWLWDPLTFEQWQTAGFPAPRNAGLIKGSDFIQFEGSPEIFVDEDPEVEDFQNGIPNHKLTFAEWQAAGSPAPDEIGITIAKLTWDTSGTLFSYGNGGGGPLTFADWQRFGFPTPQQLLHLPNDEAPSFNIYRQADPNDARLSYINEFFGYTKFLTFAEWQAQGFPPPVENPGVS